ncbi:11231_t:CDS:1, partial [Ambispora leptoticha]
FEEEDNISNNELEIGISSNTASNITNNSNIDDYIDFGNLEESNRDTFDSYYEDETNYVNPWHK